MRNEQPFQMGIRLHHKISFILICLIIIFTLISVSIAIFIFKNKVIDQNRSELRFAVLQLRSELQELHVNSQRFMVNLLNENDLELGLEDVARHGPLYSHLRTRQPELNEFRKAILFHYQYEFLRSLISIYYKEQVDRLELMLISPHSMFPNLNPLPFIQIREKQVFLHLFQQVGSGEHISYVAPLDEVSLRDKDSFLTMAQQMKFSGFNHSQAESILISSGFRRTDQQHPAQMAVDPFIVDSFFTRDLTSTGVSLIYELVLKADLLNPMLGTISETPVAVLAMERVISADWLQTYGQQIGAEFGLFQNDRLLFSTLESSPEIHTRDQEGFLELNSKEYLSVLDPQSYMDHQEGLIYLGAMADAVFVKQAIEQLLGVILSIALLMLISAIVLTRLLIKGMIGKPISQLLNVVNHIIDGNLNLKVEVRSNDEIGYLGHSFNQMVDVVNNAISKRQDAFEEMINAHHIIEEQNRALEEKVAHRTHQLNEALKEMEQHNAALTASNRKLEDLNQSRETLLKRISTLNEKSLQPLKECLNTLQAQLEDDSALLLRQSSREIHQIEEMLRPYTKLYLSEQNIRSKRILLADTNRAQQMVAKLALRGTGVRLDVVTDFETGKSRLQEKQYDALCVNIELSELVRIAHEQNQDMPTVLMTSQDPKDYLPIMRRYPYLCNIVSRSEEDRSFTIKNILTTVSKLINKDLFGLEKYISWGVDVVELPITGSKQRSELIEQMSGYFNEFGVRKQKISKCGIVAEELLMNAIYDAPTDANGKAIYNHLQRTVEVELQPEQQGIFRYASDGLLLAVSAEDPFGAFHRQTIIDYLESCYLGKAGSLQQANQKGGAGRGLYMVMETADLLVINVKPGIKTEVIAVFNIESKVKSSQSTSFHYFYY